MGDGTVGISISISARHLAFLKQEAARNSSNVSAEIRALIEASAREREGTAEPPRIIGQTISAKLTAELEAFVKAEVQRTGYGVSTIVRQALMSRRDARHRASKLQINSNGDLT